MALRGARVGPLGWASLRFSAELGDGPCGGRVRVALDSAESPPYSARLTRCLARLDLLVALPRLAQPSKCRNRFCSDTGMIIDKRSPDRLNGARAAQRRQGPDCVAPDFIVRIAYRGLAQD